MQNGAWQSLGLVSLPLSKWPWARLCAKHIVCLHSQGHLAVVQGRRLRFGTPAPGTTPLLGNQRPLGSKARPPVNKEKQPGDKTWKRATLRSQRPRPVVVSCHEWRLFRGHPLLAKVRESSVPSASQFPGDSEPEIVIPAILQTKKVRPQERKRFG